jgi:putative NIF3 family GTP cyclohydrolase 1 type 2
MDFKTCKLVIISLIFSGTLFGQQATPDQLTANQVIDLVKNNVQVPWSTETVDTFKSGNPRDAVTGIITCMFADMKVLHKAVADNANLIIAHEPVFYNHLDETQRFENDPVYQSKIKFINDHKLIIFRFHDHIHRMKPDGIYAGMVEKLGWGKFQSDSSMLRFKLKSQKLSDFVVRLKAVFPGSSLRVVGNPELKFTGVALAVGAPGSSEHIQLLQEEQTEVLIAGEAPEWETYQYVYDAQVQGKNKAVIFLGHALSEEAGMKYCEHWLKGILPQGLNVQYVENGSSFKNY